MYSSQPLQENASSNQIGIRIDKFKTDLVSMESLQVVQKHVLDGPCYILNEDIHYDLKLAIADRFELNPRDIFVVGSAKLGFSIAGNKRYRPFGDHSDIDIALVSDRLFDLVWQKVFEYWDGPGRDVYWDQQGDFMTYLFRGWIRPDKLPPARDFPYRLEWFRFFQGLASAGKFGQYKVAAGLYKSLFFLERYQCICTQQCREMLMIGDN